MGRLKDLDRDGWLVTLAGTLVAAALIGWRLWEGWLPNGDDAYFSEIARGLFRRGALLDLRVQDVPYLSKPPLFFWVLGLALRLGDGSTLAARLPSALCAIGTCLVTARWAWRLFDRRAAAFVAPLLLVASQTFFALSRRAATDAMLGLFVVLLLYDVHQAFKGRQTLPRAGLWLGLATMVKGVAAGPVVLGALLALAAGGKLGLLRSRQAALALGIAVAVAAPWHLYMAAAHGQFFVDSYLLQNTVVVLTSMPGATPNRLHYFTHAFRFDHYLLLGGWAGLVLLGIARLRRRDPGAWLVLAAYVVPLVVLTLAGTRNLRYLLPSYPALAVAASGLAAAASERARLGGALAAVAALAIAIAGAAPFLADRAHDVEQNGDEHGLGLAMARASEPREPWILVNTYLASPMYYSDRPTSMATTTQRAMDVMSAVPHLRHPGVLSLVPPDGICALRSRRARYIALRAQDDPLFRPQLAPASEVYRNQSYVLLELHGTRECAAAGPALGGP
jgi:4-amino-4-deoxy-L-arabinose transferase-like glycosyltransferase